MTEQRSERDEYLSMLARLENELVAQLTEVKMARQREQFAFDAKRARTVTLQTKELLHRAQQPFLPPSQSEINIAQQSRK